MILGLGIDIVHVRRIRHWMTENGLVERFFHPDEVVAAKAQGHAEALSLAARFAAKEAFGKALGTGLAGIRLRDIQVVNNFNGKPDMILHGTALARYDAMGASSVHISLTHESDNAVAVVVIEG
jgi:holo-[acyl-carrier protein] synthase